MNPSYIRWLRRAALGVAALVLMVGFALACTFVYLAPSLPTAASMHNIEMAVPLRIYTRGGELVSQIGEERRIPIRYEDIPPMVREAVLAAEDDRFFEHNGVDWMGFTRAAFKVAISGKAVQGGSTITQQAARQLFLTLDKTLRRKLAELFLTWRMERDFTKEQILSLYLNKIYFGQRSYGIAAAAETFYNKKLNELTVAQAATLAGIIQLPSRYNPVSNPKGAQMRRRYVLGRMLKLGYIDQATADAASQEPVASRGYAPLTDVKAPYVAELVRQDIVARFGEDAVNAGYKVYTTLDGRLQSAANDALRDGLMQYDQRHGYRGRLGKVDLPAAPTPEELEEALEDYKQINLLEPAIVTKVGDKDVQVYVRERGPEQIGWDGLSWAARPSGSTVGPAPRKAADVVRRGDVVYVVIDKQGTARLSQLPAAQAALVSLDPRDGGIVALDGGFDFYYNAFNRVTMARRQPGSGFKPFLYSAALENGFTPASVILNMPVVLDQSEDSEDHWRPKNSGGEFGGPTRLREALVRSLNLVSIRILQSIGIDTAIAYAARFGFDPATMPHNLTLALGTQLATPLQMAAGYAVFANGGFKVDPYYITRIEDEKGNVVFEAEPKIACLACEQPEGAGANDVPVDRRAPRVISVQNAWLMTDLMHDVATRGTGRRTNALGRDDLAGKTGTTDQPVRDNWFNGFNANLVATAWVGFDDERSLGEHEEGSSTALPVWIDFMREALRGMPSARLPRPDGIVDVTISSVTGQPEEPGDPDAMDEVFMADHLPDGVQLEPGDATDASGPVPVSVPKPKSAPSGEPIF